MRNKFVVVRQADGTLVVERNELAPERDHARQAVGYASTLTQARILADRAAKGHSP